MRIAMTARDLDALPLAAIVTTYDGLAWQANHEIDGAKFWTNTQDGHDYPVSSVEMKFYDPEHEDGYYAGITVLTEVTP